LDLQAHPLDAPWTAKRAAEWDSRTVAWWLERAGSGRRPATTCFEMAVRGLFTGDLSETSYLHLLFLVEGPWSINTLFSIKGGCQENMIEGGAGSIAQRVAAGLGGAVRLNAPVRSITRGDDQALVEADGVVGVGSSRRRLRPTGAGPRDRVRSRAPEDRTALYTGAVAGPESKTLVVYDEPFWAGRWFQRSECRARLVAR